MFNSALFTRSRQLLVHAFRLIAQDKTLLLFPLLSIFGVVAILVILFAPALSSFAELLSGNRDDWKSLSESLAGSLPARENLHWGTNSTWAIVRFAGCYLLAMIVSTFVNVAFYHEIMRSLAGERASLRSGLAFAASRIRSILAWSLFASSVGFVLQRLSERLGPAGRFALRFIGVAWSVAATFVIPVIIREESVNPLHLLRASAATIKKTWGEAILGFVGIQSTPFILLAGAGLLIAFQLSDGMGDNYWLLIGVVGLFFFVLQMIANTVNAIYRCALYVYATEGVVPEPYTAALMDSAWSVRKNR